MLFISPEENVLAPGTGELHLQENEDITIVLPDGDEIYVSGTGAVFGSDGKEKA